MIFSYSLSEIDGCASFLEEGLGGISQKGDTMQLMLTVIVILVFLARPLY